MRSKFNEYGVSKSKVHISHLGLFQKVMLRCWRWSPHHAHKASTLPARLSPILDKGLFFIYSHAVGVGCLFDFLDDVLWCTSFLFCWHSNLLVFFCMSLGSDLRTKSMSLNFLLLTLVAYVGMWTCVCVQVLSEARGIGLKLESVCRTPVLCKSSTSLTTELSLQSW